MKLYCAHVSKWNLKNLVHIGYEIFGSKKSQNRFIISCVDDHIFIKLPKQEQHFWSPQLHLEITEKDENSCSLHGFSGNNVWTMFMFLHVAVGILFMVDLTWLYSNYNLGIQ